jgi:GntR family transcriptional regulator
MLHFQIDPHSGVPIYRQLMDQIRYYLASGVLEAGGQLPSIREMAQTLSVSRRIRSWSIRG